MCLIISAVFQNNFSSATMLKHVTKHNFKLFFFQNVTYLITRYQISNIIMGLEKSCSFQNRFMTKPWILEVGTNQLKL